MTQGSDRGFLVVLLLLCGALLLGGCKSTIQHREKADEVAGKIIEQKQQEALGRTEPFTIERPSDTLRRRLLIEQNLPYSSPASLGPDVLEIIKHWPEPNYPYSTYSADGSFAIEPNQPLRLTLIDSLQVAAYNSNTYQEQKEAVFQAALELDLTRNNFRNIFTSQVRSNLTANTTGPETVANLRTIGSADVSRTLKNGMDLTGGLAIDLANLLTQGGGFAKGLSVDGSVSIPLLRGSGRHIVTEPLTQAERNVVYKIWQFERYKRTFSVTVASTYLSVLQQVDRVKNEEDNYRRAVTSARRSRRHSDAGRLSQVELDQAVQNELSARNSWISEQESLKSSLDSFKRALGLPTDAWVELDRADLDQLTAPSLQQVEKVAQGSDSGDVAEETPPADAPVVLVPATREGAGPFELDESVAVALAMDNRLDLREYNERVYDAQRKVVVAADRLRAELTLGLVSAGFGGSPIGATGDDVNVDFHEGSFGAPLTLNLPFERTAERKDYRNSLIALEQATRTVQSREDQIKADIRSGLRTLLENREALKIQVRSVALAKRRVRMTDMLLEAGRAQMRDVLDAQAALLSAQNSLTGAVVRYRTAELGLQRDMDVLEVNEKGLWQEFKPEGIEHGTAE